MNKMASFNDIQRAQNLGYLRMQDAQPSFSSNNIGMPAGILSQVSIEAIKSIMAFRAGDLALGGRKKLLDWEQQEYFLPQIERVGGVQAYNDYDDSIASGFNLTFGKTGHYVFSTSFHIGERESLQLAQANTNANDLLLQASLETLAIELNRVAFNGFLGSNNTFLVYGLLNNPALNAYETSAKTFSAMTWQECIQFFANAIAKLRAQTGNNIQTGSSLRVVVASEAFDNLSLKFNDLGVDIVTAIIDKFTKLGIKIKIMPALEFDKANANQNVIYFILENARGGLNWTSTLGYSEVARMSNVVNGSTYTMQKASAGTTGAVIAKPAYIVRYTNV